jgi:hypothetical protein
MIMMTRILLALTALALPWAAFSWYGTANQGEGEDRGWGKPVDGMVCRLTVQPRYALGQPITAVLEVKNVSDKKRFIIRHFHTQSIEYVTLTLNGPKGKIPQGGWNKYGGLYEGSFQAIGPGEVKRFEEIDLRRYFPTLDPIGFDPARPQPNVTTGKIDIRLRFKSPAVPARFATTQITQGKQQVIYKDAPAELLADHWAGEIESAPAAFELVPLGKDDLVVHEWGVFTVLNDAKYANANRKEEWGSLPKFFYRQFPEERLRWLPSLWDKPIVYFYAKPASLRLRVQVRFPEGAPVVWWPAAADPVDDWPGTLSKQKPRPFRALTWDAWVGDIAPVLVRYAPAKAQQPGAKLEDFPLAADCWLNQARLPTASRVTVIGSDPAKEKRGPGSQERLETERFLYYDGLVPAPDYLHCEKVDDTSVTLRNLAKFDLTRLFVVDRREKGRVRFAIIDGAKQALAASTARRLDLQAVGDTDWPALGKKQIRQALLDAGLFEAEADSLLTIWHKHLFEAEGITALHILPVSEYDRMLPLDVQPAPAAKPVRVGIALHPHIEIEPGLAQRVAGLIRALDDPKFQKRQAASKELFEIGIVAIGRLRAELKKNPSLEMQRRIEAILDRVDAMDWLKTPEKNKTP